MAAKQNPFTDIPTLDPSGRAQDHLNTLLNSEGDVSEDITILDPRFARAEASVGSPEEASPTEPAASPRVVPVKKALREDRVIAYESARDSVRILMVTRDASIVSPGSYAQRRLVELGGVFAEIHILLLGGAGEESTVTRLTDNIWIYTTGVRPWWRVSYDAYQLALAQLSFAGGFRVDVIVAEDPFEAGLAAWALAHTFKRPFQVHVLQDIFDEHFGVEHGYNAIELLMPKLVLRFASCARTNSPYVEAKIRESYPALTTSTETLPTYYNLSTWRDMPPEFDLHERYPQFKFIMLHISHMHGRAHSAEVLSGVAPLLHMYSTIGIVILGNGPQRPLLEKMAIQLGIQHQVAFEPLPAEHISHMKSANVLIHFSEDPEEDVLILEAAAVKLPIIASNVSIAGTLLKDGESAFICRGPDPTCLLAKVKAFLNDSQARIRFAMAAQEIVFERIEQDYAAYLISYRSSVERCAGDESTVA